MTASAAPRPGVSRQLAEFSSALQFSDLPAAVVAHVKQAALDGLGCCLIGATLPWTKIIADVVAADGGTAQASVFGTRQKAPLAGAVLINSTAGHAFELDDIHRDSIVHPNSIAVPIALNIAEHLGGASGQDVVTAIVAGYEIGTRVGAAAGTDLLLRGFHPQGAAGTFVAAATAARMFGLDAGQTQHALGIAGSLGAGLMASQEGAMVKRLHSGHAAESGVRAACLAQRGFTGISDVVEAHYGGFLSSFAGNDNLGRATAGLGTEWETTRTGYKPHATVTSIHAALDALAAILTTNDIGADDIETIEARVSHPTFVHCAWTYEGQSITAAQMNLFYGLTMIALHGKAFVEQFSDDTIRDPKVMAFIGRISAAVDPEIDALGPAYRHMARICVCTRDGRTFSHEERHRRGSTENPISDADIEAKFDALATPVLGARGAQSVKSLVGEMDRLDDILPLVGALTP